MEKGRSVAGELVQDENAGETADLLSRVWVISVMKRTGAFDSPSSICRAWPTSLLKNDSPSVTPAIRTMFPDRSAGRRGRNKYGYAPTTCAAATITTESVHVNSGRRSARIISRAHAAGLVTRTLVQTQVLLQSAIRRIVVCRLEHAIYETSAVIVPFHFPHSLWPLSKPLVLTYGHRRSQPLKAVITPRQLEHPVEHIPPNALETIMTRVLLGVAGHL